MTDQWVRWPPPRLHWNLKWKKQSWISCLLQEGRTCRSGRHILFKQRNLRILYQGLGEHEVPKEEDFQRQNSCCHDLQKFGHLAETAADWLTQSHGDGSQSISVWPADLQKWGLTLIGWLAEAWSMRQAVDQLHGFETSFGAFLLPGHRTINSFSSL